MVQMFKSVLEEKKKVRGWTDQNVDEFLYKVNTTRLKKSMHKLYILIKELNIVKLDR